MRDYRYNLIRYVADRERMEPRNVGIILQGGGKIDVRFYPSAGKLAEINADELRKWKSFLTQEIQTEQIKMFQPDRLSVEFLRYLEVLCDGPVFVSKPLVHARPKEVPFERVFNDLYQRLVAPPEDLPHPEESRPTGIFRRLSEDKKFLERGMKKHSHVFVRDESLWMPYRQIENGEIIAMDKVEVARHLGQTSYEIERLALVKQKLERFLSANSAAKATTYYLLADQFDQPFSGQTKKEFDLMRSDLDENVAAIKKIGGMILRTSAGVQLLVDALDKKLPAIGNA